MSHNPKSENGADSQQTPNSKDDNIKKSVDKGQRSEEEIENSKSTDENVRAQTDETEKKEKPASKESDSLGRSTWFENDGTSGIDMP